MTPKLPPYGWTKFALQCPAEASEPNPADTKTASLDVLSKVNAFVNSVITFTDINQSEDAWLLFPICGNCNDYAVTKRHILRNYAPVSELLLAECIVETGEHHLILIVKDWVLDSRHPSIYRLESCTYKIVRQQTIDSPNFWEGP